VSHVGHAKNPEEAQKLIEQLLGKMSTDKAGPMKSQQSTGGWDNGMSYVVVQSVTQSL